MANGDLCTVSEVKQLVNIRPGATDDDAFIQRLITSTSEVFRRYCGRAIGAASYDEVYDGTGTGRLQLVNTPVITVTAVSVGMPHANRIPLTVNTEWTWNRNGQIILLGGIFTYLPNYVRVAYQAGFVTVPTDVAEKCAKVAALRYREGDRLGQTSKVIGGETVSFDMKDLPSDVRLTLDNFKRVAQVSATPAT